LRKELRMKTRKMERRAGFMGKRGTKGSLKRKPKESRNILWTEKPVRRKWRWNNETHQAGRKKDF